MENNVIRAMVYLNNSGHEALDEKALDIMKQHCERQGYEVVVAFGEDTDRTGISEPVSYMMIGLAVENQIDVIVTMFSEMLSVDFEDTVNFLSKMLEHGVIVETVKDDLDDYYDVVFESPECDGDCENCGYISDEEVLQQLNEAFYEEE